MSVIIGVLICLQYLIFLNCVGVKNILSSAKKKKQKKQKKPHH